MGKIKIYLDNCCFNRPYDDQSQMKIELETKAKLFIQQMIVNKEIELIISYILEYENDDNPFPIRQETIEDFFKYAVGYVEETPEIIAIAQDAKSKGLKTKDALHLACAIASECNFLLTTDSRFSRHVDSRILIVNPTDFVINKEAE